MEKEQLDLGDFENIVEQENLDGITQDDVNEVSEMVFYFENHEGPLDVLWRLVRSTKLDIKDVKIGDITGQYLEYVRGLQDVDMESMSWFIREAAKLLEVKSSCLLPKPETNDDEPVIDAEELYKRRMFNQVFHKFNKRIGICCLCIKKNVAMIRCKISLCPYKLRKYSLIKPFLKVRIQRP